MKGIWKILLGLLLGACISLGIFFYNSTIPLSDHNFIIGVITGLAIMAILFVIIALLYSKKRHPKNIGSKESLFGIFLTFFIVSIGLGTSQLISNKNQQKKEHSKFEAQKIKMEVATLEAEKNKAQAFWLDDIIDQLDREVSESPQRILSEERIYKLRDLSARLLPYHNIQSDTLTIRKYSPEKGNLLLALNIMEIDTASFNKLKKEISFSSIDLESANLQGANLNFADLSKSNLRKAKLTEAQLNNTNLTEADLSYADLSSSKFHSSNLMNADLTWANLTEVIANDAKLDGSKLSHANLHKANLKGTNIRWATINNATLNNATLSKANMSFSDFKKSNFKKCLLDKTNLSFSDFTDANMMEAVLIESNFDQANLERTDLKNADLRKATFKKTKMKGVKLLGAKISDPNWFETLKKWKVEDVERLQEKYKILQIDKDSIYQLLHIKKTDSSF